MSHTVYVLQIKLTNRGNMGNLSASEIRQHIQQYGSKGLVLEGVDLHGLDLSGCTLSNINMSKANLSHANLSRCDLSQCNLTEANLSGANLSCITAREAIFTAANLSGANLEGSNISDSTFASIVYEGDSLSSRLTYLLGTNLEGANLHNCLFTYAHYNAQTKWPQGFSAQLARATDAEPKPIDWRGIAPIAVPWAMVGIGVLMVLLGALGEPGNIVSNLGLWVAGIGILILVCMGLFNF
jgi:uncharacterized protein YjbI with pentapeptide repeats